MYSQCTKNWDIKKEIVICMCVLIVQPYGKLLVIYLGVIHLPAEISNKMFIILP